MKTQNLKKVFVVDDDPFWVSLLTGILTDLGYQAIVSFGNGTDCINHLHLNPNLVFLDHQMDDMDGIEVLQRIKQYYPGIGVVFCTAHEDLSVAVSAIKHGSFDYILKSNANKKEVARIINQLIEGQTVTEKIY